MVQGHPRESFIPCGYYKAGQRKNPFFKFYAPQDRMRACRHPPQKRLRAPPRLFWRRRAKRRSGKGKGARRVIGGRGSAGSPPAPNTKRVVTSGVGGSTQNKKPPPRKPGTPQPLCKPLCGAPQRGGTCRLAVRRKRPGGGMGRAREGEGNHRCPSPFRRKKHNPGWGRGRFFVDSPKVIPFPEISIYNPPVYAVK